MGLLGKLPKESRPQLAGTLSCPSGFSPSSSLQCRSDDQSSGSHPGTWDDLKEGKACARMQGETYGACGSDDTEATMPALDCIPLDTY